MTLIYLQQVKSNRTKLIDFISDDIQNMNWQGYYRDAKDDTYCALPGPGALLQL